MKEQTISYPTSSANAEYSVQWFSRSL